MHQKAPYRSRSRANHIINYSKNGTCESAASDRSQYAPLRLDYIPTGTRTPHEKRPREHGYQILLSLLCCGVIVCLIRLPQSSCYGYLIGAVCAVSAVAAAAAAAVSAMTSAHATTLGVYHQENEQRITRGQEHHFRLLSLCCDAGIFDYPVWAVSVAAAPSAASAASSRASSVLFVWRVERITIAHTKRKRRIEDASKTKTEGRGRLVHPVGHWRRACGDNGEGWDARSARAIKAMITRRDLRGHLLMRAITSPWFYMYSSSTRKANDKDSVVLATLMVAPTSRNLCSKRKGTRA